MSPARAQPSEAGSQLASTREADTGAPDGKRLYAEQCGRCHGQGGRGDGAEAQFFTRPPRDLRGGVLSVYTDDELVARIRHGMPLRLELDPAAMRQRTREVESLTNFLQLMPDIPWKDVERGNEIFLDRCEICHGPFGRPAPGAPLPPGVQGAPRDLSTAEFQRSVSDRELIEIVQHGRAGMPAIPGLQSKSDAEILVAFVRSLSPGRELYGVYCSGCHGEDGRGNAYLVEGTVRPEVVFDQTWRKRQDPETLRHNVWHMLDREGAAMPHLWREVSDAQARAIVRYLRGTEPKTAPSIPPPRDTPSAPAAP